MIVEIGRLVRLFESGLPLVQIARIVKVTKQAVSERLQKYYLERPDICHETIMTNICRVCGAEESYVSEKKPLYKYLSFNPTYKKGKYICSLCKENKAYRCRSCGAMGYLGFGFSIPLKNDRIQTTSCNDCNSKRCRDWRHKYPEKYQKIQIRYRKKKGISPFSLID